MRSRTVPALALVAAAACAPKVYSLRTQHGAELEVRSSSPALTCEVQEELAYGTVQRVSEKQDGTFTKVVASELWAPLRLRVQNRTDELLSVDWERSVFVDAAGLSHRLRVYASAPSGGSEAQPVPVERPPAAVVAPGTRVEALVLPEPAADAPAMFFLPPSAADRTPLRVVLSATGSTARTAECVVTARLEGTVVERSPEVGWPGHGQPCIPGLGCAEGLACNANVCVDAKGGALPAGYKAPPRRKKLHGEPCDRNDDCVQGFTCDMRFGTCQ